MCLCGCVVVFVLLCFVCCAVVAYALLIKKVDCFVYVCFCECVFCAAFGLCVVVLLLCGLLGFCFVRVSVSVMLFCVVFVVYGVVLLFYDFGLV